MQGREQVIIVVPIPVRPQGAFLGDGFHICQRQGQRPILGLSRGEEDLHGVHGLAQVTAAGGGDVFQRPFLRLGFQSGAVFHEGNCPAHRFQCRLRTDLLELKHGGAAENGVEYVKIGIFRGGGDESDLAVFNVLQQGLLLLFVEGLNLVQVQQHPVGGQKGVQLGHDLLDVRSGGGGGIELEERPVGLLGDDVRHRGLTGAAGTVEHHVGDVPGVDQPPQHSALPKNMLLSVDLVQRGGPQKIGQWLIHSVTSKAKTNEIRDTRY